MINTIITVYGNDRLFHEYRSSILFHKGSSNFNREIVILKSLSPWENWLSLFHLKSNYQVQKDTIGY